MENRLKKGLGRGLSSLLGDTSKKIITNKVSIKDISRNKFKLVPSTVQIGPGKNSKRVPLDVQLLLLPYSLYFLP